MRQEETKITTAFGNILSMIACANDYGHGGQIFDHFTWTMIGESLSDQEIELHALSVQNTPGYGVEDYEDVKRELEDFRQRCVR